MGQFPSAPSRRRDEARCQHQSSDAEAHRRLDEHRQRRHRAPLVQVHGPQPRLRLGEEAAAVDEHLRQHVDRHEQQQPLRSDADASVVANSNVPSEESRYRISAPTIVVTYSTANRSPC